jgi:hypothetical protein
MEEEGTRKDRDFEELVQASQPKFLEALRETSYLAVLGSLCITISAFTQQNYPQAQAYAIAGASLFLIAFVCSFITKIIPSVFLLIPSYLSTGLGILMLFLVITQFSNSNVLVLKMLYLVVMGVVSTIFATIPFYMYRSRRKAEKKVRSCLTISLISFAILTIDFPTVLTIPLFYSVTNLANVFLVLLLILVGVFAVGLAFMVVAIVFSLKKGKSNKEAKITVPYLDEGSGV